jgi:N6-L-threonylcarbamoyladenine synthase
VAANTAIRNALTGLSARHGFTFVAPPLKYCTDNAAMIALAGLEHFAAMGNMPRDTAADMAALARPRWPLDEHRAESAPVYKTQGRKGAKA